MQMKILRQFCNIQYVSMFYGDLSACFMEICPFGPQASAAQYITHHVSPGGWPCLSYSNWLLLPLSSLDWFLEYALIFLQPAVIIVM